MTTEFPTPDPLSDADFYDDDAAFYDQYAAEADESDGSGTTDASADQKPFTHRSVFISKAIFRSFRVIPNDAGVVADLALMSGQSEGKQRFLNGSFFISRSLMPLARKIGTLGLDVRVEVEIGNLHCVATPDKDDATKIYANYRGFLNKITFG